MNDYRLPLTFSLDPDSLLDTLEAVLAIARRGNLRLARLQMEGGAVALELDAHDPDLLDLFGARLHNVIGVHEIAMQQAGERETR
jgi:hypothetical protein